MRLLPAMVLAIGMASSLACKSDNDRSSTPELRNAETVTLKVSGMT